MVFNLKEYSKEYQHRPEVMLKNKLRARERYTNLTPEKRLNIRAYSKKWYASLTQEQQEKYKLRQKTRLKIPSVKLHNKIKHIEYYRISKFVCARRHKQIKQDVIAHYSNGNCVCLHCGFSDIRALSIDHINSGGTQHKKVTGENLANWLKKNNFPTGYQVLCMNCQFIKREEEQEVTKGILAKQARVSQEKEASEPNSSVV